MEWSYLVSFPSIGEVSAFVDGCHFQRRRRSSVPAGDELNVKSKKVHSGDIGDTSFREAIESSSAALLTMRR